MNYNRITNYYDFVQLCLTKLGAPVINIEIADNQIKDRITDALQFYMEHNSESVRDCHWIHKFTEEDEKTQSIAMPLDVIQVLDIKEREFVYGTPQIDYIDSPEFQFWNGFWNNQGENSGLVQYELSMQQLSVINQVLRAPLNFVYRVRERKIYPYKKIEQGRIITIHGYRMIDPENDDTIWESRFLKKYATALLGEQWGLNISKYGSIPTVGGLTLNGDAILQRYTDLVKELEEKHKLENEEPPMFFFG